MNERVTTASKNIVIPKDKIAEFCQRHHIRKLSLFGSVLRDDFTPESDVDVLVEFEPETTVGLRFIDMQDELSAMLGCTVDLNTPGFLSRHFRQRAVETAEVICERKG
jgi:predicted nucleotidyltransferase